MSEISTPTEQQTKANTGSEQTEVSAAESKQATKKPENRQRWRGVGWAFLVVVLLDLILFQLYSNYTFVPYVNNGLIVFLAVINLGIFLYIFFKVIDTPVQLLKQKVIKTIICIVLNVLILFIVWFTLLTVAFVWIPDKHFVYGNNTYYYQQRGMGSLYLQIYKQSGPVTMEELKDYSEIDFASLDQDVKTELKSMDNDGRILLTDEATTLAPQSESSKDTSEQSESELTSASSSQLEVSESLESKDEERNEFIRANFSTRDILPLANSNLGLLLVNKAGSAHRYYLVRVESENLLYISEVPETAAFTKGSVFSSGEIVLYFEDTNGKMYVLSSSDGGKSWEKK